MGRCVIFSFKSVRNTFILYGMAFLLASLMGCTEKESKSPNTTIPTSPSAALGPDASGNDTEPPRVIATFPLNGAQNVDPTITEISVTFNEEMLEQSWSWAYKDGYKVPEMPEDAYYTDQNTKNILPVRLKPNKEYVLWINTEKFNYFKDRSGNSVVPYEFKFKTR